MPCYRVSIIPVSGNAKYLKFYSSGHFVEVVTNAILCYHSNVHEKMYPK